MKTAIKTIVYVIALIVYTTTLWNWSDESANSDFLRFLAIIPELATGIVGAFIITDTKK
ncbi:MAG: hypothetical protein MJZ30_11420 [Paludibacteraceae bacterium]|nr:hypothetical protein [Paludibacteraceae bacterium]